MWHRKLHLTGAEVSIGATSTNVTSNKLKQWRGIAMRSGMLVRTYRAATPMWIKSDLINTD